MRADYNKLLREIKEAIDYEMADRSQRKRWFELWTWRKIPGCFHKNK